MNISAIETAYGDGNLTPTALVEEIYGQIEEQGKPPVWVSLVPRDQNLLRASKLEASGPSSALPLYGIPFAVKDNFDVEGMPTTAGCPAFAHEAEATATAVQRLLDAGAILIGKTNMDQFATGLVGTRTPYGICSSVFKAEYISGGSSSGSAVAVASGLVSFSLGTDTAGSGRVPAAFNQLIGMKPTRGWISTEGLLPACRTLDCVSIFAETCADAERVFTVARGFDAADAYSRVPTPGQGATPWSSSAHKGESNNPFRFGVPTTETLQFFGDEDAERSFHAAVETLTALGGEAVRFDYEPFRKVASLLYSGPWVAERFAALKSFIATSAETMDPTVRGIVSGASRYSAVETFDALYLLEGLRRETTGILDQVDFLLLPTTATHYTIEQVRQEPIQLNSNLGYYTNFVNLLDLSALAIPAGFKPNGLPFSVSLIGKAFTDHGLLQVADRLHRELSTTLGGSKRLLAAAPRIDQTPVPYGCIAMAVVGAHLTGQPLNWQLTQRKARLMSSTRTNGDYRLYAVPNTTPPKPGLVYAPGFGGDGIEVEVWAMPEETVGSFLNAIPPPLSLGTLRLENGTTVKGFLCEPAGIDGAEEITHLGGWRKYVQGLA